MAPALPQDKKSGYTYREYREWPDNERWELTHGVACSMSPAPNTRHQAVLIKLAAVFLREAESSSCEVFPAPTDVVLGSQNKSLDEADTVVQPDIVMVCNSEIIHSEAIVGPPEIVVEILSPSTGFRDQSVKFSLYEDAGVAEYWIVNPETRVVEIFPRSSETGKFGPPKWYRNPGTVASLVLGRDIFVSGIWDR